MRLPLLALLGCGAPALAAPPDAGSRPTAALVVGAAPGPSAAELTALRARAAERYRLVDDGELRAALEQLARPQTAEERVRAALATARQRLRLFDLPAVAAALATARAAAAALQPTPEGRALLAEVGVRQAELALVSNDEPTAARAMALALSAAPSLALDARYSPPLRAALARAQKGAAVAPRRAVAVTTSPPGAEVTLAEARRGATPLALAAVPAVPEIVWLTREGYVPRVEVLEPDATRLAATLHPLGVAQRLLPLVEAVRGSDGPDRRGAAQALAAALQVDALLVTDAAGAAVEYARPSPSSSASPAATTLTDEPPPPPRRRPWYRRPTVWIVTGAFAAVAVATGLTVGLLQPPSYSITCCR